MIIINLRDGSMITDRAICDLLELQERGLVPGQFTTQQLRQLWRCSQSQVSRRMAAIDRLGPWRVMPQPGPQGGYWVAPRLRPAPPLPLDRRQRLAAARSRWDAARARLAGESLA